MLQAPSRLHGTLVQGSAGLGCFPGCGGTWHGARQISGVSQAMNRLLPDGPRSASQTQSCCSTSPRQWADWPSGDGTAAPIQTQTQGWGMRRAGLAGGKGAEAGSPAPPRSGAGCAHSPRPLPSAARLLPPELRCFGCGSRRPGSPGLRNREVSALSVDAFRRGPGRLWAGLQCSLARTRGGSLAVAPDHGRAGRSRRSPRPLGARSSRL